MKKEHIFSFKVDAAMAARLEKLPNRSAFVRQAIETALETSCPLCQGSGTLTEEQQEHWDHFLHQHSLEKCHKCNAVHFICQDKAYSDLH